MDNHFSRMLNVDGDSFSGRSRFIPSEKFTGARTGYYFSLGEQGLGYYHDHVQDMKRKVGDFEDVQPSKRPTSNKNIESSSSSSRPAAIINDSLDEKVIDLDANSLKQLLLSLEKKITKNQKMRMKFSDLPEKFMESEMELNDELNKLQAVAATPALYPILVSSGSVVSILGLVTHDNTDVSVAAIGLLQELTEPDTVLETEEAHCIVDAFLDNQGLELVVQNLSRLDEANEDDAQGVYNSMSILENLIELKPEVAVAVCEKTHILKFLLMRLKVKKFDANKLYCSEMLSILLQADPSNQKRVGSLSGADGMDLLLQNISHYRRRDPVSVDEEEAIHNLFLSMNAALLIPDNQTRFRLGEGLELMLRCIKELKYAAGLAVRTLSHAIDNNKSNCERLVDAGGLKVIFPMLMGRGLPKSDKKKGALAKREIEEAVVAIVSQLCLQLFDSRERDCASRLLLKLTENDYEKLDRCSELFAKYSEQLKATEARIEARRRELEASVDDEEELEELLEEEDEDGSRMRGGLYCLQLVALVIAFVSIYDPTPSSSSSSNADGAVPKSMAATRASLKLGIETSSTVGLQSVLLLLRSMAAEVDVDNSEEAGQRRRKVLIDWSAAMSSMIELRTSSCSNAS